MSKPPIDSPTNGTPAPRVLMVSGHFNPVVGGAEKQAELLSHALIRAGARVEVATFALPRSPRRESLNGLPVERIGLLPAVKGGKAKIALYMRQLSSYIVNHRDEFDIVHAHQGLHVAYAAAAAAVEVSKPCVVKIANTKELFDLKVLESSFSSGPRMAASLKNNTDCFVALNKTCENDLADYGVPPAKIRIIPNGVDTSSAKDIAKTAAKAALPVPEDTPLIVFVGVLRKQKNAAAAVEAAKILKEKGKSFFMAILGGGAELEQTAARISLAGLGDVCAAVGPVDNVREWLAGAEIFFLPSFQEGMSNALLEAMSAGLACAVSDIPANRDIVSNGINAVLFDPASPPEAASALDSLLTDANLRKSLGKNARATVERDFSIDTVAKRYIALYRELISAKSER